MSALGSECRKRQGFGVGFFTFDGVFTAGAASSPVPVGRLFETSTGLHLVSETAGAQTHIDTNGATPNMVSTSGLGGWSQSFGFAGDTVQFRAADIDGILGQTNGQSIEIFERSSGLYAESYQALAFDVGPTSFFALGHQGGTGFATYSRTGTGDFQQVDFVDQTQAGSLGQISGLAHASVGGNAFLVAISAGSDFIASFQISASGEITERSTIGIANHLPIADPSDVDVLEVSGKHFVVVASAGSSSLTVLELDSGGGLHPVDQVMDDRNTRFQGADQIECFEHDGRAYIIAAGQDEGISLFTLMPNGRIVHLETVADTLDTAISKIADMEVVISDRGVHLYTLGAADGGITQFTLNLGTQGHTRVVSGSGHRATHDIDVLVASEGGDSLEGRNDADILMDAGGNDTLYGGWGADLFILDSDGASDTVADFQPGADSLDLSAWGFLRSADQLTITSTDTGAVLEFGDERLVVNSVHDAPLRPFHFSDDIILNATHVDLSWVDTDEVAPAPTAPAPADPLPDLTPNLNARAFWGNQDPASAIGGLKIGSGGDDDLQGNGGNDTLFGGAGQDKLNGDAGQDHVRGMTGQDTVTGGHGADMLLGGSGDDQLYGGSGQDTLDAGAGNDTLYGGSGQDVFMFDTQAAGRNTVGDFRGGSDIMALRGVDGRFDALDIRTVSAGGKEYTEIAYDDQVIVLEDVASTDIDTTDFWFL